MAKLEDFIVQTPYQPSDKEKAAISELKAKGLVPGDWSSGKTISSRLRIICVTTCIMNRIADVHIVESNYL